MARSNEHCTVGLCPQCDSCLLEDYIVNPSNTDKDDRPTMLILYQDCPHYADLYKIYLQSLAQEADESLEETILLDNEF